MSRHPDASGQDYAAVESVEEVGSQLPLLGDRPNQPRILSFPSKSYGNRTGPSSRGGLIAIRGCTTLKVWMLYFAIPVSSGNADNVFTRDGYNNWKSATEKKKGFRKHETSASHQEAVV